MNKNKITLLLCICAMSLSYLSAFATSKVTSPNGRLSLLTGVDASGKPYFELLRDNKSVIKKSYLGVSLKDGQLFEDFKVKYPTAEMVVYDAIPYMQTLTVD